MAEQRVQRRLAAILAADVVGYSRLMGEDEEGTRTRFNAHLAELIEPAIANHRGRIVKTTGDALLVEFASLVDVTESAIKVPRIPGRRNEDLPEDHPDRASDRDQPRRHHRGRGGHLWRRSGPRRATRRKP